MDLHQNARLTFRSREALVKRIMIETLTLNAAAAAFNVSRKTAAKGFRRYRTLGLSGLRDGSSRPLRSPRKTSPVITAQVIALRRQLRPAYQIAQTTGLSPATVAFYAQHGITIRRLLTDNGSCYRSRQFRAACAQLHIQHRFTRPYTPRTNGKAERFIQSALREWAYVHHYTDSVERDQQLSPWLDYYNFNRPHGSLGYAPPISRAPMGTTS
ncbi:MAG TPA: leucine zipper domain-containing protein [Terriglobales bacterium]|nr:leucine zipper domain-containing protein [Terriglobales bacterium]